MNQGYRMLVTVLDFNCLSWKDWKVFHRQFSRACTDTPYSGNLQVIVSFVHFHVRS